MDQLSRRTIQYTDNPQAFTDEIKLNYFASLIDPFCSICTLLRLFEYPHHDLSRISLNLRPPLHSRILIPKLLFNSKVKQQSPSSYSLDVNEQTNVINNGAHDQQSSLVTCSSCKLCVHFCKLNLKFSQLFCIYLICLILFFCFSLLWHRTNAR